MKTSRNILRSHGRKAMLALVSLAALTFGSCADDDVTSSLDGDKGANVSFNVSQAQDNAQAAAKGMPVTRASFTNELALQGLTPADLPSQKIDAQGLSGACLIETTTAGIDNNALHAPAATRANIKATFTAPDKFTTIGYRGATASTITSTPWFYDKETKGDGTLVNAVQWRWAQPFGKFFAVYPRPADYTKLTLSPESYTSTPYVDFEVDPDVTKQTDFMTAFSGTVHYATHFVAPITNLQFTHALTAVRFKVGQNLSWNKTITKIEIVGAKSKARYTLPTTAGAAGTWGTPSAPATFTLSGLSVSTSDNVNNIIVGKGTDNGTFYMLPQTLTGAGVQVKVYFNGAATPAITATLTGTWKPGTTKTYALSQNTSDWSYVLNVVGPTTAVAYNQTAAGNYTIQSYRQSGGTLQPVKWKVVGYQESTDGGANWSALSTTKPAWLDALPVDHGDGKTSGTEGGAATVQTATLIDKLTPRNKALKEATPLGSASNYYDLSTKGGSEARNTANCYVISAPGYYKIPLVYGNAIKNGSTNSHAYKTSNTGAYILSTFQDHAGVAITDPWITQTNGGVNAPDGAKMVWADENGIVETSSLGVEGTGTNAFVHFHIPADKIKNGNAVIAVTKGSTVVWSWHLWFAPQDVLNTIACTNFQNHVYKFTKETLGWKYTSWQGTSYSEPRKVRIKVEQLAANGGVKQHGEITITQNPGNVRQGYCTLYQGDRKDAFPGTDTYYYGTITGGGDGINPANSIQNPLVFYTWGGGWYGSQPYQYNKLNYWSMDNTVYGYNDNPVVKTIYDPCPAGFHIPASNAFTGFTTNGASGGPKNVSGGWDHGWTFNNKITNPDATIYFPATGGRSCYSIALGGVGTDGNYFTASQVSSFFACLMLFNASTITNYGYGSYGRGNGTAIRPVAE